MSHSQSIVSEDVPSPPGAVLLRPSRDSTVEASGLQSSYHPHGQPALRARRKYQRPMHNIMQPPSPKLTDNIFAYFETETEKNGDARGVFVLWGSENSEKSTTWAIDIRISDPDAEEVIFHELKARYYAERGVWRKYFALRDFIQVKPVVFRFISKYSDRFSVSMEPLDLSGPQKDYLRRLQTAEEVADSITDFESSLHPEGCDSDEKGKYSHNNWKCPLNSPDGRVTEPICPFEEYDLCSKRLNWIKTVPFLTFYFRDPAAAQGQDLLNGFGENRYIHYTRNIKILQYGTKPQRRDLELDGLYVKEGWKIKRCFCIFGTLLVLVVFGGKLIWGSWEVVFGAGSFFIAVPMIVLAGLGYSD